MGRLLLITDYAPPYIGGMETHAHEYARALTNGGRYELQSVFLRAPDAPDAPARFLKSSGITEPVHVLPDSSTVDAEELIAQLRPFSPGADTVLFFNSIHWTRVLPAVRSAFPDAHIVLRSGGNDIIQAPLEGTGDTLADRQAFIVDSFTRSLDALIVNSTYSKERAAALGMPPSLMHVVRGGVDVTRFIPASRDEKMELRTLLAVPPHAFIALAVCRLESFKGLVFALEVLAQAQPKDFLYVIVGDGPLFSELQETATKLGIDSLVRFCRTVPHNGVHEYFRMADLYCHFPEESVRTVVGGMYVHTETMGRSFCEAMASGLPILASSVGGVPEIVENGTHGILIPTHDFDAARSGLMQLIEDPSLCTRMGEAGRQTAVASYSWDAMRARYEDIFSV